MPITDNRILLVASVSDPSRGSSRQSRFRALVDTGATISMASRKVVEQLGVYSVGRSSYVAVNGAVEETDMFMLCMDVPIRDQVMQPDGALVDTAFRRGAEIPVLLMKTQPTDYDVLWGMDFLSMFHITIVNGQFILSN